MTSTSLDAASSVHGGGAARGRAVICVPSGTAAANLLRSRVFPLLRDSAQVGRLVILSPLVNDPAFREEFEHEKVALEPLLPHEPGWLERRIIRVLQEKYVKTMPTTSMRIRVARERHLEANTREVRYLDRGSLNAPSTRARRAAMAVIKRLPLSLPLLFKLSDLAILGNAYRELFRRERPHLVVTPTTGIYFAEGPLMARADAEGVPIVAADLSWDHFTTKTAPLRRVAALSVWNERMKREAMTLHGYRADQVTVSGVPQFDLYAAPETYTSREAFFARIGADPSRALVTLATIPPVLYQFHDVVIDRLLGAIRRGELGRPAQLLVRVHPRDDIARYERFQGEPDLIIEKPFRETLVAEGSNVDPSAENRRHLANTLRHSDVLINVHSTVSIEGAIADTPVVNIAFDGNEQRDFLNSARRYYELTHYKPVVETGAVRVAYTQDAMVEHIRVYLQDPSRDREGRRKAVSEFCYQVDGKSSERVAALILERLAALSARG